MDKPLYSVRFFVAGHSSMPGVCDEEVVTSSDPFVLARRVLKLDVMREEGVGFSRAEVYKYNVWPEGATHLRTVRVSRRTLDRFSIYGAIRRGVRNAGLRKLAAQHGIPYLMAERNQLHAECEALTVEACASRQVGGKTGGEGRVAVRRDRRVRPRGRAPGVAVEMEQR